MKERGRGCQPPKGLRGGKLALVAPRPKGGPPHAEGHLLKVDPPTYLDPSHLCLVLKQHQEPLEDWGLWLHQSL